jgi:malonate transporter and related proteins
MSLIFDSILPLFIIIASGWLSIRLRCFDAGVTRGLVTYVFYVATPALLVRALARTELPGEWPLGLWVSYFVPALSMLTLGTLMSRWVFARPMPDAVIAGFSSAFSNGVLIGAPVVIGSYGDAAALPYFLIIALHSPLLFPIGTFAMEVSRGHGNGLGMVLRESFRQCLRNPIIISLGIGLTLNLLRVQPAGALGRSLDLLAESAAPCALFATGAQLAQYHLSKAIGESLGVSLLKLVLMPLAVGLLGSQVFHLPQGWLAVACTVASLPTGVNAYLLGSRYQRGLEVATSSIVMSTALSLLTLSACLWWFRHAAA